MYTALSLVGGLVLAALSWLGLEELIPGFLRKNRSAGAKSGAAGSGSAPGGDADRQLRRPAGIRASTMVIPMPELAGDGQERPEPDRAGDARRGSRDGASRDRTAASRGARSRGSSTRPGRARHTRGDDSEQGTGAPAGGARPDDTMVVNDPKRASAPVDVTMHLKPQGLAEQTMHLSPKSKADGPGYPESEDTIFLGRRFSR